MRKKFKTNEIFVQWEADPLSAEERYRYGVNADVVSYVFFGLSKLPPEPKLWLSIRDVYRLETPIYHLYYNIFSSSDMEKIPSKDLFNKICALVDSYKKLPESDDNFKKFHTDELHRVCRINPNLYFEPGLNEPPEIEAYVFYELSKIDPIEPDPLFSVNDISKWKKIIRRLYENRLNEIKLSEDEIELFNWVNELIQVYHIRYNI